MATTEPQRPGDDGPAEPGAGPDEAPIPPRPTTPPVRRGFLTVLFVLSLAAALVYGVPFVAGRAGYAWEAGRSRAASEALVKLDREGALNRASELFRMAAVAVSPAVVNIRAEVLGKDGGPTGGGLPLGGPRFGRGAAESVNVGSGVIIDRDRGLIVTNNHVINGADKITVRLSQGAESPARLVGADPKTDLAVIRVEAAVEVAAAWGDSDNLSIGDWVLAIGSPFLLDHTVTAGIVSATGRNNLALPGLDENAYQDFIQTDAAINPGNSGGPLIDLNGKVIGINTAILTANAFARGTEGTALSGGFEGIGLAIPSAMARRVVESLISKGKVVRGFLGVVIQPVTPDMAVAYKLPDRKGAVVAGVKPGGPAAGAGLQPGDVVVGLAGKAVADPPTLRIRTADLAPGLRVPLDYYRGGECRRAEVVVGLLDGDEAPALTPFGFRLRELPPGDDPLGGLAVDQVVQGSPASRAGLRLGQRVVGVNNDEVHNRAEFARAAAPFTLETGIPLRLLGPDGRVGLLMVGGPERKAAPPSPH